MARRVDQHSRASQTLARGPAGLTSCPRRLVLGSEGPWGLPAVPCDWDPCPRAHGVHQVSQGTQTLPEGLGVNQLSRVNWACARCLAGSTSCAVGLGPKSNGPRGRPAVPGSLRLGPMALAVNQLSRATRAHARCSAVSASSPGPLRPVSEVSQCRLAVPGKLCLVRVPAVLTSSPR